MKKFLKIAGYTVGVILLIMLIPICFVFVSNTIFIGFSDSDNISYLQHNKAIIEKEMPEDIFDDDLSQSDVFLFGEIHGYAANQKVDQLFFQFLNRYHGIRHYIAEMDSTTTQMLNRYLSAETKNEALLREVVVAVQKRIPQQSSQELFDKWSSIYDYNRQLADSVRMLVIGLDTDFDEEASKISRDSAMVFNFVNTVKKLNLEGEKFYGLFGLFHTLQHDVAHTERPFAARLRKSGFKTTSIISLPLDSEMYLPANPQFPTPPDEKADFANADGPIMLVKGIKDLKAATEPNSLTLFKLNGSDSPYVKSQNLISIKSRFFGDNIMPVENSNTLDYFQYVLLTRNSEALSKLR